MLNLEGKMANPVFIGVGGTGQTVLASYLRLAKMAGFTPAPFYVVDSDTKGPLSGSLTKLKSQVDTVVGGKQGSRWMIDPFPTAHADRKTFGSLFGNMTGDRRELFNCLFSEEAEQTSIRTGMYGRPSIGATSIRYKILQNDVDLIELKDFLRGGEKHIILVGSCFGGTGSGGVPMLAAEFSRLNKEENYSLKIDAVMFLPWFRLDLPEGDLKGHDKSMHEHLSQKFEPNAAAGIHFFKDKIREYIDTLFLVGVKDPGQIGRISNESSQGETPHILNLLVATLIQNHFAEALKPPLGIAGYWYDEDEKINPSSLIIHQQNGKGTISLLDVIKRTALRKEWIKVLKVFFQNYPKLPKVHKPIFIQVTCEKLMGTTRKEAAVLSDIVNYFDKYDDEVNENFKWIESMCDGTFFTLEPEQKRVVSDKYDSLRQDPLPTISDFCNDDKIITQFEARDFYSIEDFCGKFNDLFLDYISNEFEFLFKEK